MRTTLLACLIGFLSLMRIASAQAEPAGFNKVRIVYLVSKDRQENAEYKAAIEHAIRDLQQWYGKQLGGPTFRLSDPVVEVQKSGQLAAWFSTNPKGNDKDSWGYHNAFDEVQKLCGTKYNDPKTTWVIYSDGPGHNGRGGSGVACLPEDDLLGLIGKHPTQKDTLRWIAGLGHELGHAFGLPHPSDTKKDADAIMWSGIYGKYPDKTYLTAEDKKTLMRSPFFYREDGSPVFKLGKTITRCTYEGGAFEQHEGKDPIYWTENKASGEAVFTFEESMRDARYIYLIDRKRDFAIRLPLKGGKSELSTDHGKVWKTLYQIAKPTAVE